MLINGLVIPICIIPLKGFSGYSNSTTPGINSYYIPVLPPTVVPTKSVDQGMSLVRSTRGVRDVKWARRMSRVQGLGFRA